MSDIRTTDPVALRYLMTETLFGTGDAPASPVETGRHAAVQPGHPAIATPSESMAPPIIAPSFRFYGGNKRNYLFLNQDTQHEWMSPPELEAFTKTLAALKLTLDDVALLNLHALSPFPSKEDLIVFFKPRVVVALGVSHSWEELEDIAVFNTCTFDEMLVDAEKKRLFWNTVKTLLV
jgi:hypothetical protein